MWCSTLYFYKLTAGWNFDGGKCGKSRFPDSGVYITGADSRINFYIKMWINIWFAVALALVGLYFLCMQDKNGFQPADLLLLCCALGFSIRFYLSIIFHRR